MADSKARRFEQLVMPHLDSAYNLARYLTRSDADAQDVVQEACLRAFKYFDGFDGQYANAWLLKIVRNTCFSWLKENRAPEEVLTVDDDLDEIDRDQAAMSMNARGLGRSPEELVGIRRDTERLNRAIEALLPAYREILILREMDDFSYREIADIVGVPIGTVMSRLARARGLLQAALRNTAARSMAQ
ncbi:MAG TPA: sigma-70 family RNA polymerase sigma factor [Stellaceae bacterium]